jgi:hypothetical protein
MLAVVQVQVAQPVAQVETAAVVKMVVRAEATDQRAQLIQAAVEAAVEIRITTETQLAELVDREL